MDARKCSRMDTMSDTIESSITDIHMAYRLILHSRINEAKNKGDKAAEKAAQAELEKDEADISSAGRAAQSSSVQADGKSEDLNVNISLTDLIEKLRSVSEENADAQTTTQQTQTVTVQQTIETEASLTYYDLERVDGLVLKNRNLAETDRYRFEFQNGSTLKITDKWSNRSTTIWGDPHIDTSDEEGSNDGDFKDLKGSDQYTTFMLSDGTRLTITARDNGIIEMVDIFKGSQHLTGIGGGSKSWDEENSLFNTKVKTDALSASSSVAMGDVVYAGGDGNDWFDAAKNLIWGTTTGPVVTTRPSSFVEFQYNQRITQSVTVSQVNQQA